MIACGYVRESFLRADVMAPSHTLTPAQIRRAYAKHNPDWWAGRHFYIPETKAPVDLQPYQRAFLQFVFRRRFHTDAFPYTTVIYSSVKKSGKTAIAGMVARWAAEFWGNMGEIYALANDYEQAEGRIFSAAKKSIELTPGYDVKRRELPGKWRVREGELTHIPTGSTVKALAGDYVGEAGANPSLTLWSELWGYSLERARRLWDEMTPPPTREIAMRWVETYAGFEGESELLWELYDLAVNQGARLTVGDLTRAGVPDADAAFEESPRAADTVPIYVNDTARLVCLWDTGEQARRMPWQRGERGKAYYTEQKSTLRDSAFRRFHLNKWASAQGAFVERVTWDACQSDKAAPFADYARRRLIVGDSAAVDAFVKEWASKRARELMVVAVDASTTGDCTALVALTRPARGVDEVVIREAWVWTPAEQPGGNMDYDITITPALRMLNAVGIVKELVYDPYQLEQWAIHVRKKLRIKPYKLTQGQPRLFADKGLYDLITQRRLHHDGGKTLTDHVMAAAGKDYDGERMRLIKKGGRPIDAVVAVSMGAVRCLYLRL